MVNKETLLEQKKLCDIKLAKMRAKLTEARADARLNGRYMQPAQYSKLELEVKMLAQRSQEIQNQLTALKRNKLVNINDCFREAAGKILPEKTFFMIMEMAHDIKRAREVSRENTDC